jgi:hypothetical protein
VFYKNKNLLEEIEAMDYDDIKKGLVKEKNDKDDDEDDEDDYEIRDEVYNLQREFIERDQDIALKNIIDAMGKFIPKYIKNVM